ncbi:Transcription factor [Penicillium macrosclerotiorum]|uniref:Transcription factor n=1 Tax=Penicillium macrosclerotiorum TaxID=303699 RepID=UPI0025472FCA|nr:Transcription factor [Penicillium macrosclerotiorum]KAJ5666752.1 Transcription factor [Penicillium macrosclerotiorum]
MDLSLHEVGSASPESRDIQTRVWWITLWPILMRAQEAMLKTGVIAKEMADGKVKGSLILLRQRVCELDCFILAIIADLDQPPDLQTGEGADAAAVLNQWLMARFLAHT